MDEKVQKLNSAVMSLEHDLHHAQAKLMQYQQMYENASKENLVLKHKIAHMTAQLEMLLKSPSEEKGLKSLISHVAQKLECSPAHLNEAVELVADRIKTLTKEKEGNYKAAVQLIDECKKLQMEKVELEVIIENGKEWALKEAAEKLEQTLSEGLFITSTANSNGADWLSCGFCSANKGVQGNWGNGEYTYAETADELVHDDGCLLKIAADGMIKDWLCS